MRKTSVIAAAALVCTAAGLLAAPVGGAVNSRVTIGVGFDTNERREPFFRGRVTSGNKSCMGNRVVVVYRARNGGKSTRFRAGRTTSRGFWRVLMSKPMRTAAYFAVVEPRRFCGGDKSRQVAVGQRGPGGLGPGGTGR